MTFPGRTRTICEITEENAVLRAAQCASGAIVGEPAFGELVGILPALLGEERTAVLMNALVLARAFAGRRGTS